MAIFETFNGNGNYRNENAIEAVTEYIFNPYKSPGGYLGGCGVNPTYPAESMINVSEGYGKASGVRLRHYVLSFAPNELNNPQTANEIGTRIAALIGREYQVIYAVHENKKHLHIHIMHNAISFIDGHRFYGRKKEFYTILKGIETILSDYGIYKLLYYSNK